jgi:hypothetical protein
VKPLVEVRVNEVDAVPCPEIFTSVAETVKPGVAAGVWSAAKSIPRSAMRRNLPEEKIKDGPA